MDVGYGHQRPSARGAAVAGTTAGERAARSGEATVLRLSGEIDLAGRRALDDRLRGRTGLVVVDLSGVIVLSAAALAVLIAHADRLSGEGGRLLVVPGGQDMRRLLHITHAEDVLDIHDSVSDALADPARRSGPVGETLWHRVNLPDQEARQLRRRLRTQPTIARALAVVRERYGLPDGEIAFTVLRDCSQRHNLRLHLVAGALLTAPPPSRPEAELWFPGRRRQPGPPLSFAGRAVAQGRNRTAVLDALLDAVTECMDTDVADLQMIDLADGQLWLERQRGMAGRLLDVVDSAAYAGTAPSAAVRRQARVVVADVATDPVLGDSTVRSTLLAAGCRAMQSTPLLRPSGRPVGVVSTHDARTGRTPTAAQRVRMGSMTAQAGAWLEWHRRTVVLDALEQVHRAVRQQRLR